MSQLFQMDRYLIRTKFWRVFGGAYAQFIEDSIAILRRFVPFIPAKYHFEIAGQQPILMQQRFNPIIKQTDVMIPPGHPLDRRVIAAVALLSSAIEGRQG